MLFLRNKDTCDIASVWLSSYADGDFPYFTKALHSMEWLGEPGWKPISA